jgi:hypothetical protein
MSAVRHDLVCAASGLGVSAAGRLAQPVCAAALRQSGGVAPFAKALAEMVVAVRLAVDLNCPERSCLLTARTQLHIIVLSIPDARLPRALGPTATLSAIARRCQLASRRRVSRRHAAVVEKAQQNRALVGSTVGTWVLLPTVRKGLPDHQQQGLLRAVIARGVGRLQRSAAAADFFAEIGGRGGRLLWQLPI